MESSTCKIITGQKETSLISSTSSSAASSSSSSSSTSSQSSNQVSSPPNEKMAESGVREATTSTSTTTTTTTTGKNDDDESKSFLQETQRALNNLRPKPPQHVASKEPSDEDDDDDDEAVVKSRARACTKLKRSYQLEYSSDESDEYEDLVQKNISLSHKQSSLNLSKSRQQASKSSGAKSSSNNNNLNTSASDDSADDRGHGKRKESAATATPKRAASLRNERKVYLMDNSESSENSDEEGEEASSDEEDDEEEDEDEEYIDEDDDEDDNEDEDVEEEEDSDYSEDFFPFKKVKKKKKASKAAKHRSSSSSSRKKKTEASSKSQQKSQKRATGSVSHSKRATTSKTINYCEESDEEDSYSEEKSSSKQSAAEPVPSAATSSADEANIETIEKVLKHRLGRVGATGSKTAIYNVEESGDPNTPPADGSTAIYEDQYLIKWQNWAHLHNTWESRESLLHQKAKGFKKLENFLKKQEEIRAWKADASSPEDVEFYECQLEMLDNLLESHTNVERIVSSNKVRQADGTYVTDYLCKWQGLPYSDCTWEDGELIKKRFLPLVQDYDRRQTIQTFPPPNVKNQKVLKVRPRFVALKEKPAYLGRGQSDLKLRDYQLDGLNWLAHSWCKQNSIILADEMGLGKTIQTISFISYVFNEHSLYGPFLLVIPLSTIQGWQREFEKWAPEVNIIVYLGDINSRNMIQKYELTNANKRFKCNGILTTYEILLKDKAFFSSIAWSVLMVDEAHRLKNEDSLLYRTLINFDTNHRVLITGTPLQNSLKELWALLHFIMPERFESWEEFDGAYSSVLNDGLRFQELHRELQPYLLRRVKKDVEKSLPSKVEQILRVEMTNVQKSYYKLILTKNYKELSRGAKGSVSSFLNIMMELKKCSNHSYLIRRDDDDAGGLERLLKGSGKLLLLDKLLRRLKETGHRVLIFSQMVRMLDIIAEYLQYRRFPFQRLDGSIKGEIRRQALDHFNKPDSEDFCFLLSTRAGGLGINLATADTVIIYDSDWNPQNDLQAQARAHRIGQKNQVNIYRLVSKNSIEEDIVERAKQKIVLDHLVIQRMDTTGRTVLNSSSNSSSNPFSKEEINSILKFGAEELFKEKDSGENAVTSSGSAPAAAENEEELQNTYDIDEILKRAETRAEEETNHVTAIGELLSQFKVANFSTMEDDPILPSSMGTAPKLASARKELPTTDADKLAPGAAAEKSWDDIIPLEERQRIELEIEEEQLRQFNLASMSRRNRATNQKDQYLEDEELDEKVATTGKKSSGAGKKKKSADKRSKETTHEPVIEYDDGSQLEILYDDDEQNDSNDSSVTRMKKQANLQAKYQMIKNNADKSVHFVIKGLNTQEVRRFLRSFKKFPCPLLRIDTIAQDAQLEEKSQACLIDFATKMKELFTMACKAYDERFLKDNGEGQLSKKRDRGPTIVLNGIKLNARQILETEKYFEPLADYFARTEDKKFKSKLKQPYWDCDWAQEDDWALLKGIYEYGYGNWELIKADASLNLTDKILRTESKTLKKSADKGSKSDGMLGTSLKTNLVKLKPQSKHLKTRVAYLMKVLASQIYCEKYGPEWKSIIKKSDGKNDDNSSEQQHHHENGGAGKPADSMSRKIKRKLMSWSNEHESSSDTNQKEASSAATSSKTKRARKSHHNEHHHHHHHHNNDSNDSDQSEPPHETKPKKSSGNASSRQRQHEDGAGASASVAGSNHHSSSSASNLRNNDENNNDHDDHAAGGRRPHHAASDASGAASSSNNNSNNKKDKKLILSEKVFNECKNLMRPVKKALKNIDVKEINMTERDEIDKMKKHLLEIGDQINDQLSKYSDPDKIREWRNYLWVFVSKFSSWNPERLRNLYKKLAQKRNEEELESKPNMNSPYEQSKMAGASSSSSYLKRHEYDDKSYYGSSSMGDDSSRNKYNMSPPSSSSSRSKKSSSHFKGRELSMEGYDSPAGKMDDDSKHGYFNSGAESADFKYDYYSQHHSSFPSAKQQQQQQSPFHMSKNNPNHHHHHHHQHHHSHHYPSQNSAPYNLSNSGYGGHSQQMAGGQYHGSQNYHHGYSGGGSFYGSGGSGGGGYHDNEQSPMGSSYQRRFPGNYEADDYPSSKYGGYQEGGGGGGKGGKQSQDPDKLKAKLKN